jgi:polar amino acid transport system ATP-binding protein
MDGGVIVEEGPPSEILVRPQHPRTRDFLARVTETEPDDTAADDAPSSSKGQP